MAASADSREELFARLRDVVNGKEDRIAKARRIAEVLRGHGSYRWVGLYDVNHASREISNIAFSGPRPPAISTFPISKGLTGAAVRSKTIINVGDVRSDHRYLTSLGSTMSEIIIPIIDPLSGNVVGTLDAESEHPDAFSPEDEQFLKSCADSILSLWSVPGPARKPALVAQPTRITAAGNKPKLIDEYIGRVNSHTDALSVAHMRSPSGWVEPGQAPEFDEFTVVLKGTLRVAYRGGELDVAAGQAVICPKGEWVQYSTPGPEGAEYIAVCLPAFSMDTVHRDQ